MNHRSYAHPLRGILLPLSLLAALGLTGIAGIAAVPSEAVAQTTARQRSEVSETVTARASRTEAADRSGVFTMNRVRLFVISAHQGTDRVILPPMAGDRPARVMNEAVDSVIRAVERIRRRYRYDDLRVVSQSQYLLQAYRGGSGDFLYQLVSDPGAVTYSAEKYWGELEASGGEGELAMDLRVLQAEDPLFQVSLLLDPGRALVVGKDLPDGGALFAVLTLDHPGSPLRFTEEDIAQASPPSPSPGAPASEETEGSPLPGPRPERIYEKWDEAPRLLEHGQPEYPDIARRAGVEGTVTLHLVVGRDGKVEDVQVFRSTPRLIFDRAASEAVREWRYEPARVDGRPVRSRISQTLRFVLNTPKRPY